MSNKRKENKLHTEVTCFCIHLHYNSKPVGFNLGTLMSKKIGI